MNVVESLDFCLFPLECIRVSFGEQLLAFQLDPSRPVFLAFQSHIFIFISGVLQPYWPLRHGSLWSPLQVLGDQ